MLKARDLMRVLSVFVAVVIVAVGVMSPIAYANPVAIGGGLLLLMASLLVISGMTFTSQSQLEAAASYATSNLPSDLREELNNVIEVNFGSGGGSSPQPPKLPDFRDLFKGITTTGYAIGLSAVLIMKVKAFICDLFGINEETAAAGSVTVDNAFIPFEYFSIENTSGERIDFPIINLNFVDVTAEQAAYIYNNFSFPWSDYIINGYSYRKEIEYPVVGARPRFSIYRSGTSSILMRSYYDIEPRFAVLINTGSTGQRFILLCAVYGDGTIYKVHGSAIYIQDIASNKPVINVSSDAYAYTPAGEEVPVWMYVHDYVNGTVSWGDYVNKNYMDVTSNHRENFDWYGAVLQMSENIGSLTNAVNGLGTMPENVAALQNELNILSGQLAGQTSQAIESAEYAAELNVALVNAYAAMQNMMDAVSSDRAITAEEIATLTYELAKAREEIAALNGAISGNPLPDVDAPPVSPPVAEGAIDWSILQSIDAFDIFPFCLPWDVYAFFSVLAASPKEPVFVIPIRSEKYGLDVSFRIDFVMFEDIFRLVRSCILIMFVIGLIGATKKYIWTGGG